MATRHPILFVFVFSCNGVFGKVGDATAISFRGNPRWQLKTI